MAISFLSFLLGEKKKTASVAKERLQIILAHERSGRHPEPDYLPALQRDLVAVISKYIKINPDDIKVNVKGNEVSISVEVNKEKEEKEGDTVIHSERYVGRQYRSFTLPVEIDEGKVEARYLDGVLDLRLPKRAGDSGAKQISIS